MGEDGGPRDTDGETNSGDGLFISVADCVWCPQVQYDAEGINGDIATCAVTLNAVRAILEVGPGLKTMADLPAPSWFTRSV